MGRALSTSASTLTPEKLQHGDYLLVEDEFENCGVTYKPGALLQAIKTRGYLTDVRPLDKLSYNRSGHTNEEWGVSGKKILEHCRLVDESYLPLWMILNPGQPLPKQEPLPTWLC